MKRLNFMSIEVNSLLCDSKVHNRAECCWIADPSELERVFYFSSEDCITNQAEQRRAESEIDQQVRLLSETATVLN